MQFTFALVKLIFFLYIQVAKRLISTVACSPMVALYRTIYESRFFRWLCRAFVRARSVAVFRFLTAVSAKYSTGTIIKLSAGH